MGKKILSLALALCLAVSLLPASALAAGETLYEVDVSSLNADYRIYTELNILNNYRAQNGLKPLKLDVELTRAAMQRAAEISVYYNGSHLRPNGNPWYTTPGIHGTSTAENIAYGFSDASSAMQAWENSSAHNRNLLDPNFKSVGIGFFCPSPGQYYWTQDFSNAEANELVIDPSEAASNSTVETYSVEILASNLTPGYLRVWQDLLAGESGRVTAIVENKGISGRNTAVVVHRVESLTPDIASASLNEDGTVTITGLAQGTAQLRFTIGRNCTFTISLPILDSAGDIFRTSFQVDTTPEVYDGRQHYKWVESSLVNHTDYEVSYRDSINAGTATIVISGNGRYYGETLEYHFTIEKAEREFDPGISNKLYINGGTRASVWPRDNAGRNLSYRFTSSNTNVVRVDDNGELYAVAPGYSTITIEADETENYKAGRTSLQVMVTDWSFEEKPATETPPPGSSTGSTPAKTAFTDVPKGIWYYDPVNWAVERGITQGTGGGKFSPYQQCTQAEIITFLWRAAGEPRPAAAVTGTDFYAKAVQWARENGIIDSSFVPLRNCTRKTAVTYMWKYAGSPTGAPAAAFPDVPAGSSFAAAVAWAVQKDVTKGTDQGVFLPETVCDREQIVTFLYRAFAG